FRRCGERAAVSEMACHGLQRVQLSPDQASSATSTILVIDTVKTETSNAVLVPLVRAGIDRRCRRQRSMVARIKDRNLRDGTEHLFNKVHAFKFGLIVERRKCGGIGDRRFHLRCNDDWLCEMRSTMNDAMTDNIDFRNSARCVTE